MTNTVCTIYKNTDASMRIKYVTVAIKFNDDWIFLKHKNGLGYELVTGVIKDSEPLEIAVRRELYNKVGIVAANIYNVAAYSVSTGYGKFGKSGRNVSYGMLYFAECICLGKTKKPETANNIVFTKNEPNDNQYAFPSINSILMKKIKSFYHSDEKSKMLPFAFEKLCGAVTFCRDNGTVKYILIKNLSGHIGFPKGHSENSESEYDTAKREVFEETGLSPEIYTKFKHSFSYVAPGEMKIDEHRVLLHKRAVYFVAEFSPADIENIKIQEEEVLNWWLVPYQEAIRLLNKNNDKRMLELANRWIEQNV